MELLLSGVNQHEKFILAFLVVVLIVMLGVTYVLKQFQQTADLSYSKLQSVQSTVVL